MSNRLTFSLASLVLIFVLTFAAAPVIAATGGPTVTFEEYSGVDDPAADPSGQDAHTQARDDFRVKITFNHPVSAPAATDVKYRLGTSSGFAAEADSSAVTAIWTSATTTSDTAWVVTLPAITDATATQVVLIIADDVVTGSSGANLKGNVGAQSSIFTLPPLNAGTVSLAEPKAVANARGQYTVLATFDSGTTTAQTLTPTFDGTYVQVMPKGDATVTVGASDSTTTTGKTTATITVQLLHGTEFVNIKIDPGYVKGSNTVKVPADDPTKQTPPMVTIAVSEHDPDARTFQIDVMATPQMDNKGGAGTAIPGATLKDNLEIKDNADTNVGVTVLDPTSKNERPADNRYQAILTYSTFDELPLTVTLKEAYKVTGDRPSAMVGTARSMNNAPVFTESAPVTRSVMENTAAGMAIGEPVAATDADTDDTLTYTLGGTDMADFAIVRTSGQLQTKAALDYEGTKKSYMVTVTVSDGTDSASIDVTINVTNDPSDDTTPNMPPVFNAGLKGTLTGMEGVAIKPFTFGATDSDGGTLAYSWDVDEAALGLMLNTATGTVSGTPNKAHSGSHPITVMDGQGGSATHPLMITITGNTAPEFSVDSVDFPALIVGMAHPVTLPAATDADGDTLTYSIMGRLPFGLSASTNASMPLVISGTPRAVGTTSVTYVVSDSRGGEDTLGLNITVNDADEEPPPVDPDAPAAPTDLTAMVNNNNTVTLTWTEPAGDITGYIVEVGMTGGTSTPARLIGKHSSHTTGVLTAGTYIIKVAARNAAGTGSSASVTATIERDAPPPPAIPVTALIDSTISLPAMSIPAHSFVILQRNPADSGIYAQVSDAVVGLANLDHLFRDRGGIALRGTGTAKDLVFSEIMWGSDSSLADDTHSQWIELYNTTTSTLELSNYTLEFYSARIAPTPGAIDEINTSAWGDIHGQRGRTSGVDTQGIHAQPVEIISMYRKINYAQVRSDDKRADQLKAVPVGSGHGSWAASTRPSLNIAATWRLATPGAQPRYTIHGASSVPRNVIISEIGNSATDAYDWFELYNTTDGEINLKKWQLSRVTKDGEKGKEVALLKFPDNDNIKIPAKSYLVIAASNPKNDGNDLAAGIDITKTAINQVPRGLGERGKSTVANYAVLSFSLPNDANRSLLILRSGHGNEGKAAGFIDVIGTLSIKLQAPVPSDWTGYDKNNTVYYNTSLWPLHATGGPHGNVIDGGDEDFRAGKVYQRNNFGGGTGEKHLAVRGYTGVGYDRQAAVNGENGGTPGYSKDAVKGDKSNWMDQVTISEIMLVTEEGEGAARVPRATRLPQWFEIYNASMTEAVSINNWYLEIQNDDTEKFLTNLNGTLRLPNVIIQPNQTVLVVSNSGLNSGNFPDQRTINVFTNPTYRQILGLQRRGEPMLNPEGFYIELRDHKGNQVDEIGNLGVSRRTGDRRRDNFGEQWVFPTQHTDDGHRTSLIRVYDNGMPESGLMETSWRRAADTSFRNVPSLTYYGNHRDFGTPGYRGGGPLPVSLSKFRPERLDSGEVVIRWITQSELNNAGFNILRSETKDGEFKQINTKLIAGQGTTSEKMTYEWKDTTAKPNVVYYYQIQDVSIDGKVQPLRISRLKGHVSPAGKATTTWGELKALQ